jgi:hypothetical protein
MEPTLTEFSYGYCVTEELANRLGPGLKVAPYFPSLYSEGQKGGGFDVRIGGALFLQFKLCEKLTRGTAKEAKAGLINPPFYRFWLHRKNRSNQHRMLIDLENQTGNQVYYIAPGFAELDELNSAYVCKRVVSTSGMFSPREIGPLPDNEQHRIAFRLDSPNGWFLSEPQSIAIHRSTDVLKRALSHDPANGPEDVQNWLFELAARMKDLVRRYEWRSAELFQTLDQVAEERDPLRQVVYLAHAYFACEVLFAAEPR